MLNKPNIPNMSSMLNLLRYAMKSSSPTQRSPALRYRVIFDGPMKESRDPAWELSFGVSTGSAVR